MKKIITLLLVILCLNSCFSSKSAEVITQEIPILEIQHGGCYGTCPIYTLSLYEDYRVRYQGKRFVEYEGIYIGYLNNKSYKDILNLANKSFTGSENINLEVQDLPKTSISFLDHKIQFKGRAPKQYKKSLELIEDLLLKHIDWKITE